jgi:hypothetical protein
LRKPELLISIPLFSPGNNTFFPAIQFAPVGMSVPAFSSQSDLLYVPKLRTYLYERSYPKTVIFFRRVGRRGPSLTWRQKKARFQSRGFFPESRGFFPGIAGMFPRDFSPGIFPRDFCREFTSENRKKCAHWLLAPEPVPMVRTATQVFHKVLTLDSLRLPASCGIEGSFLDAEQCGRMCKVDQ